MDLAQRRDRDLLSAGSSRGGRALPAEPFEIALPDSTLDDLRRRLERARLPHDFANDDWSYGTNGRYLQELVDYWRGTYDWRARERAMNAFHHSRVDIDGVPIHFLHERGRGPNPMPLVLSHGWPWTFWDYREVIGPLSDPAAFGGDPADAFDVVVPSLPGFAFSTPLTKPGINFWKTADLWLELMTTVLGYDRFAVGGGDWGSLVSGQIAHKYPDNVIGIYVIGYPTPPLDLFSGERPWDPFAESLLVMSGQDRANFLAYTKKWVVHVAVQVLEPQTLAYAMHDSPVGLCAWLVERRQSWSDCGGDVERRFSKDVLLDHVMLYWATDAFVTSARFYAEAARHPWSPAHPLPLIRVPIGYTSFRPDMPKLSEPLPEPDNLVFAKTRDSGGHFAPAEEPAAFVEDVRATFRNLR
jgi:pimeloyl-ACP methyl ester carboxylesterase